MTVWMKIKYLRAALWMQMKSNILVPVCFLAKIQSSLIVVLLSVYILLWIDSYVDSGVIASTADAKILLAYYVMMALVVGLICFPFAGILIDNSGPKQVFPIVFFLRIISVWLFTYVQNPESRIAFASVMLLYVTSVILYIIVDATLMK